MFEKYVTTEFGLKVMWFGCVGVVELSTVQAEDRKATQLETPLCCGTRGCGNLKSEFAGRKSGFSEF